MPGVPRGAPGAVVGKALRAGYRLRRMTRTSRVVRDAVRRIRGECPCEHPLVLEAEFPRLPFRLVPPMKIRVVLAALALGASGTALAQATFTPIPNASGVAGSNQNGCWVSGGTGYSTARVSADGSTVALTIYRGGATSGVVERDFAVWTPSGGATRTSMRHRVRRCARCNQPVQLRRNGYARAPTEAVS